MRPPAVAGSFYPDDPAVLARDVDQLLKAASTHEAAQRPKALIVPHAGYIYSGPTAAVAYASVRSIADRIRRVVILGPAHFVAVDGLAIPDATAFETPLGAVVVDRDLASAAARLPAVLRDDQVHGPEHSLEVQLPFLQRIVKRFSILPIAVGSAAAEEVGAVVEALWGDEGTLILVSSDLSHYLRYEQAMEVDQRTADQVVRLGPRPLSADQACGATPINGLLVVARKRRLTAQLLDLRNSGDTKGPRNRVVGYGAFAFS